MNGLDTMRNKSYNTIYNIFMFIKILGLNIDNSNVALIHNNKAELAIKEKNTSEYNIYLSLSDTSVFTNLYIFRPIRIRPDKNMGTIDKL
jgi:hypothetical protein